MRAALIEKGIVTNVIELPDNWTGAKGEWPLPKGATVVFSETAGPGDTYDGAAFIRPARVYTKPAELLPDEITKLRALLEKQ